MMRTSTSLCRRDLIFSKPEHLEIKALICSSSSVTRMWNLRLTNRKWITNRFHQIEGEIYKSDYLMSSISSVWKVQACSYLDFQDRQSWLTLESWRSKSKQASASSSSWTRINSSSISAECKLPSKGERGFKRTKMNFVLPSTGDLRLLISFNSFFVFKATTQLFELIWLELS